MSVVTVGTTPTDLGPVGSGITVKNTGHKAVTLGGKKVVFGEGQELAPGATTTVTLSLSPDLYGVTESGTTTVDVTTS